jgi:hypothetical protein
MTHGQVAHGQAAPRGSDGEMAGGETAVRFEVELGVWDYWARGEGIRALI